MTDAALPGGADSSGVVVSEVVASEVVASEVLAAGLVGGLLVCGTASDSGKTTVVTGLCRLLARRGIKVAPFKAQNMSLNSAVTASGHEIGRATFAQAQAAGVEAEAAMNPILLKPTSERASQVIVEGRPWATLDASAYERRKPELVELVQANLAELRSRFDVVVCEGAGSPTEINLLDGDLVNLPLAQRAGLPAIVVGDIDRGGVFAALYGTVALLPPELRELVGGFVINKLRGDPDLLGDGPARLEAACGVPTLGVLPWVPNIGLDAEDSLALARPEGGQPPAGAPLDVAVIRFPRVSNFTDLDPLAAEPGVALRWVADVRSLGWPDLIVLPGSKATVADLDWLRRTGLAASLLRLAGAGRVTVAGICGGYQMLGRTISDPDGVETGGRREVSGLELLNTSTTFSVDKVLRRRQGSAWGERLDGYEIHHGSTAPAGNDAAGDGWLTLDGEAEGATSPDGVVCGTSLHGLWEADGFRGEFLRRVAARVGKDWKAGAAFAQLREQRFDRLADLVGEHLDLVALASLIRRGAPR